jgi:hypothetical protein
VGTSSIRWLFAIVGCASAIVGACSSFSGSDDDGTRNVADGSSPDVVAPAPADSGSATDAVADAGGINVLTNGDFETLGCAGWETINASGTFVSVARTGTGACEFCQLSSAGNYLIWGNAPVAVLPGEQYAATALIRQGQDGGSTSTTTRIVVFSDAGTVVQQGTMSGGPMTNATWTRIDAQIEIAAGGGGGGLGFEIYGSVATASCIIIDDAFVRRLK